MLIPLLHRVIVQPDNVETVTPGGIVLAIDPKKERTHVETGKVVSIGETVFKEFKAEVVPVVGDRVYYAKYAGKIIKDTDNVEYLALNDDDLIAVIK